MKFALVDGNKIEALKGVKGVCPSCGSELVAKCGDIKINHWAHKGTRNCDNWWEKETEWHRSWKNEFPIDWQEITIKDEKTNEKHIADVKTKHGLVIEFQHSYIDSDEQNSREVFYKNMVWVVNGGRLKFDYPRFVKAKDNFQTTNMAQIFAVEFAEESFPKNWLKNSVPVIIDFQNASEFSYPEKKINSLYCLFPNQLGGLRIVAEISKSAFINKVKEGEWSKRVKHFIEYINISDQNLQKRDEMFLNNMIQNLPRGTKEKAQRFIKEEIFKRQ